MMHKQTYSSYNHKAEIERSDREGIAEFRQWPGLEDTFISWLIIDENLSKIT